MNAILNRIQNNYPVKARIHGKTLIVSGQYTTLIDISITELSGAGTIHRSRGKYLLTL